MIAALYVDPGGPYPHINGVEWWGLPYRDARAYNGPHPVVAHPPCGPWSSKVRKLYKGNEHDCALRAVEQVRKYGGVLEHPAGSKLWEACNLPEPHGIVRPRCYCSGSHILENGLCPACGKRDEAFYDTHHGYALAVNQCDWGHVCRKPTWLYLVGVQKHELKTPPPREPTHWASGGRTKSSRKGSPIPPGIKAASSQQKRRTPPDFARYLVKLATSVPLRGGVVGS